MWKRILLFILTLGLLSYATPSFAAFQNANSSVYYKSLSNAAQHNVAVHLKMQPEPTKKQSTAFILALIGVLLLPIGLHRFYLGYKSTGIIMLILTLTGIGAIITWIWTLIDLFKIINGSLKPADGSEYADTI
jgi:TM2 domain-containing membrane protein YozV